ncbi:tRNA (adenosine(37)-N6)-threonylcarbamoyltransferase complex dimerization subunit type 1 TsaB [Clostridia bacterium]|nr:tRNA (adenosine(37)-N6)-threonylcarbamoyltransferase complex dimerization subunit type 1 TsaB [Clostridia bacterium]
MLTLAIETTGFKASVALGDHETGTIFEMTSEEELNHLKDLVSMIDTLMNENGFCAEDIGCIAASEGPGSFTGIRIGVATARALAQAWGIKTLGVPTLAAFAHNLPDYRGIVCPVFDARRQQVYSGVYFLNAEGDTETIVAAGAWELEELFSAINDKTTREIMFFGDGLAAYGDTIKEWGIGSFAPEEDRFQKASSIIRSAFILLKKGEAYDYSRLMPVYLRKAEAQRKLELRLHEYNRHDK